MSLKLANVVLPGTGYRHISKFLVRIFSQSFLTNPVLLELAAFVAGW